MSLLLDAPRALAQTRRVRSGESQRLQPPHVSVVIVNYCQWENTTQLVSQICNSPHLGEERIEVVVVDNHSPPSELMKTLRRRTGVWLRRWSRNRGFARAVNEGARLSEGNWILLLNPDVTVNDVFLDGVVRLCRELERDRRAGIVGFQLDNSDGSRQLSWGPFPSLAGTLLRMLLPRWQRKYATDVCVERRQVPWVTGCCLLVRRECLQELAGFNAEYFLYYEDVDLCRRARQRGWQVWFEPRLRAVHHHPLHTRRVPPILRLVTRHSLMTYAQQHWPRWQQRVLTRLVRLEASARACWSRLRGDRRSAAGFAELAALAGEMQRGNLQAAGARLQRVLRQAEQQLAEHATHNSAISSSRRAAFPTSA
jgi:GT2 family glycosyltransferase